MLACADTLESGGWSEQCCVPAPDTALLSSLGSLGTDQISAPSPHPFKLSRTITVRNDVAFS